MYLNVLRVKKSRFRLFGSGRMIGPQGLRGSRIPH